MKMILSALALAVALPTAAHAADVPAEKDCCEKMKAEGKKCCCDDMAKGGHAEHQDPHAGHSMPEVPQH
jgi:hypothetical protein